jgi:hypothetical protein
VARLPFGASSTQAAARKISRNPSFRLLVKSPRSFDLSSYMRAWLAGAPKPKGNLQLEVDIDRMSFY